MAGKYEVQQGSKPDVYLVVCGNELIAQTHVYGRPTFARLNAEAIAAELNALPDEDEADG